jgi:type I restriction enzyme S subunit
MFGDPTTNPKGWKLCKMAELCVRITDGTHLTPKFEPFGVPFLFVKNVRNGCLSFDTDKFISQETYLDLTRRCPINVGDVLYVTVGATYGDAVLVESETPFCFQRHLAHLKPDPQKTRPTFLHNLLRSSFVKRQADRRVRGAAQPTLNLGELRDFDVYMPPLEVQVRFEEAASVIQQVP